MGTRVGERTQSTTAAPVAALSPPLTVVIPTGGRWEHLEAVVDCLRPAVRELGIEVIAVCAGGGDRPRGADDEITHLSLPSADLFAARAAGAMLASSEFVALLEDHVVVGPTWAAELIEAWRHHPDADALVGPMNAHDGAGVWETALFTLTFGPFLGATETPTDRLPVPGHVSLRRSRLPAETPAPGWLEYELLGAILAEGRAVTITTATTTHVQPTGPSAILLSFHSARMYAGTRFRASTTSRRAELRRLRREGPLLVRQTFAGRRRVNGNRLGALYTATFLALLAGQMAGQLLAITTRSPGSSGTRLE